MSSDEFRAVTNHLKKKEMRECDLECDCDICEANYRDEINAVSLDGEQK